MTLPIFFPTEMLSQWLYYTAVPQPQSSYFCSVLLRVSLLILAQLQSVLTALLPLLPEWQWTSGLNSLDAPLGTTFFSFSEIKKKKKNLAGHGSVLL